ncbi:MAG: aspartate carbamoyltransferase [Ruminococcus sp.]|nr:aspartate carbamoyltransferase [Ruminococcus sp.]
MTYSRFANLIDLSDVPAEWWLNVVKLASDICDDPGKYSKECSGKMMATLFYEPSTRTQMSFQAAMLRLGGTLIGFDNPATSSVAKGENLKDTTKIVSSYADILVMRHPSEGAAKAAALTADCPIINAGDGSHLHPTQTLTDMLTLYREKGRLEDLTIGLCGDLKNGRTVHSMCKALSSFKGIKFVFISAKELGMPDYIKDILREKNCVFSDDPSLEHAIGELDMLYMTRVQKERFSSEEEYNELKDMYRLDAQKLNKGRSDLIVLHPLPRVDEIAMEVDDDPRAMYFKQAKYGMYVRMALIMTILKDPENSLPLLLGEVYSDRQCANPNCITKSEYYLPRSFIKCGDMLECDYCSGRSKR